VPGQQVLADDGDIEFGEEEVEDVPEDDGLDSVILYNTPRSLPTSSTDIEKGAIYGNHNHGGGGGGHQR
jgi:hypothetical protein